LQKGLNTEQGGCKEDLTMQIKPIKNERDYKAALKRIESIWDAPRGSPKGDELEILSILVEHYEMEHHAISPPDAVEAIKFRMDQLGMKKADLAVYVGGKNRSTEILKRKRGLSVSTMRALHSQLGIPAESLLSIPEKGGKSSPKGRKLAREKLKLPFKATGIGKIVLPLVGE
jgi:HTH-type transcriptional regulator / antitoxin HigA